jgi:adenosylcobinamide-GDP ribazoletransferase
MLPPFVHDTLKWLRNETALPLGTPPRADEDIETIAENPGAGAYAAPVAAAVAGLVAAAALLLFWNMYLPPFAVAAMTVAVLAAIRGLRFESGTVRAGDRLGGTSGVGNAALVLLLLVETAALEGLIFYHAPSAALVVIVAAIFGSTASIVFRLTQPARPLEEIGELSRASQSAALQGLMLVTIVIGTALLLPVFRIGATASAFVGALAAFVAVVAIGRNQNIDDVPDCAAAAGKAAEAATLLAVLAIIRTP